MVVCSAYCSNAYESLVLYDDHSYSTAMSQSGGGGPFAGGGANSTSARANNSALMDESLASAQSSAATAAAPTLANSAHGISVNSTAGTNVFASFANKPLFSALPIPGNKDTSIQELRKSLTLDFTNADSAKKSLKTPELLSLFGWTPPDLETFLTQGVSVIQTPTPTQFFYPKNVTAEQETYARGFIDALNQVYQQRGPIPLPKILSPGFVVSTIVQDNKDTAKNPLAANHNTAASVFPGPSSQSVNFNAVLVSNINNLLAAISTSTSTSNVVPEPAFVTTVSSSSTVPTTAPAIRILNQTPVISSSSSTVVSNSSTTSGSGTTINSNKSTVLVTVGSRGEQSASKPPVVKLETERCTPSPSPCSSRSSSAISLRDNSNSDRNDSAMNYERNGLAGVPPYQQHRAASGGYSQSQFSTPSGASTNGSYGAGQSRRPAMRMEMDMDDSSSQSSSDDQSMSGSKLPMPLDPVEQERWKLERKRARNREAATKCRRRKIERIQDLEGQVNECKQKLARLEDERSVLQDAVMVLRQTLTEHHRASCDVQMAITSSNITGNRIDGAKSTDTQGVF